MPQRARARLGAAAVDAVVQAVTARLWYKAAALFFAFALWVVTSGDEPAARYVDVRLAPVLADEAQLLGPPPKVQALVAGPARELLKLYTSPPVLRRAVTSGASDTARVELRAGDVDLPSGVDGVAVRDVRPRVVTFRFETLAARRLPVRVAVRMADGVEGPEFVVDPESVVVRGPRHVVRRLAALPTVARVVAPGEALGDVALDTAAFGVRATPARVRLLVRTRTLPAAAPASPDGAVPDSSALPSPSAPDSARR